LPLSRENCASAFRGRQHGIPTIAAARVRSPRSRHCSNFRTPPGFSLQKIDGEDQIARVLAARHIRLLDARNDFAQKAALIEGLDLVVSVDTSNAHLAGALGKPVWILLPFAPDWRWGLARTDSPWYPTGRLFRQCRAGDWTGVVADVRAALVARVKEN
jgi:hypothetical protein